MERIASFEVDHDLLNPGIYISRVDGDVVTYDLRTRKPNAGEYMDDTTMHTVEHMMATYLRYSPIGKWVVYFGPMGCRTGFYLLVRDLVEPARVLEEVMTCLWQTVHHSGDVFGASQKECGNYRDLDLEKAKDECQRYIDILNGYGEIDFEYPTANE